MEYFTSFLQFSLLQPYNVNNLKIVQTLQTSRWQWDVQEPVHDFVKNTPTVTT